jgi:membrane associated rhomboid family serine protease
VNFILLLAVFGGLAFKMTSPADRAKYLGVALDFVRQVKVAATQPRPENESFRTALRTQTRDLIATPALVTLNAAFFTAMLFGAGAIGDPDTLVGWGASLGTHTTNGEWWRLVTSAFVHFGMLHLFINILVLAQVGAVLERLVGRFAFTAVYLSAGVFAGLINLSAHPVAVTIGSSGAIFGLYGLMVALVVWQQFHHLLARRVTNPETGEVEIADPGVMIPRTALKRLGYGAAVFVTCSLVNGLITGAELTGLLVGFGYGIVLVISARNRIPAMRPVGAALAAAVVMAVACAIPLRSIADVAPEISRVVATEERTATTYQAAFDAFKKGRISAEALAQLAERRIVPELQAVDARLTALKNVPFEHQPIVNDAREYLRLRSKAWRVRADAIRKTNTDPLQGAERAMDATWRLQAQAQFRANQVAMGNAEGAERASLEAFQRVRGAPPPVEAAPLTPGVVAAAGPFPIAR